MLCFFFCFRKTVQLQWARFKKGPFLPEADISGKKEEKMLLGPVFALLMELDTDMFLLSLITGRKVSLD